MKTRLPALKKRQIPLCRWFCIRMTYFQGTLYDILEKNAREMPGRPAYTCAGRSRTWKEHFQNVNGAAAALRRAGVKKGDRVAVRAVLTYESVLWITAAICLGAVAVPCDPHGPLAEFLDHSPPVGALFLLSDETGKWQLNGAPFRFRPRLRRLPVPDASPFDCTLIIFTSGSTGLSKAVMLREYGFLNVFLGESELNRLSREDVFIGVTPLFHIAGFGVVVLTALAGAHLVFDRDLRPDAVLERVEKWRCNWIVSVPGYYLKILAQGAHRRHDISSLKYGLITGGPYTKEQFLTIERELNMTLRSGCGMTEASPSYCGSYIDDPEEIRAGSLGRPFSRAEVKIVGEDGCPVPEGHSGEICVRGPGVMLGYYGEEEATREAIDEEGWLHSGDVGFLDANGCLHLTGRRKDIIIRNGNNLSCAEIERKILQLPFIAQAAVTAVPDPLSGEMPAAMLVLKEGETFRPEELERVLTRLEMPKMISLANELPVNSRGKVNKQIVKEAFLGKKTVTE